MKDYSITIIAGPDIGPTTKVSDIHREHLIRKEPASSQDEMQFLSIVETFVSFIPNTYQTLGEGFDNDVFHYSAQLGSIYGNFLNIDIQWADYISPETVGGFIVDGVFYHDILSAAMVLDQLLN